MRFDEFVLRVPGEDDELFLQIRFHDRLTVLAGLGALEREAIVEAVVGGLTGEADGARISCLDHTGRPVEITTADGLATARYVDDGTAAPAPVGWLAPDALTLRDLVIVTADDLGPSTAGRPRHDDPPVLVAAREALVALTADLQSALEHRGMVEQAHNELVTIDERVRAAEEGTARREYARVLTELDRVRAEASALQGGVQAAESDRALLASADEANTLIERWRAAAAAAAEARAEGADDEALDAADVARLATVPPAAPAELATLVAEVARAAAHVTSLEDRLRVVASASLPEPDDGRVLALAGLDQVDLWAARDAAVEAAAAVGREQVAVGGIGADGERAAAIAELERAHRAFEAADELVQRRRVPVIAGAALVALLSLALGAGSPVLGLAMCAAAAAVAAIGLAQPLLDRSHAAAAETASLEKVGVPSYLGFHLRRVDATIDPSSLGRLTLATMELEAAERGWVSIAGDVSVEDATALEHTVRAYAAALASRAGAVQEVAELRRTLDELALPDLEAARAALVAAVEPYAVGAADVASLEPDLVLGLVARQVTLGAGARRRVAAESAAREEQAVVDRLEAVLVRHGFVQDDVDTGVTLLLAALKRAGEREAARAAARPREVVEAELARLGTEARRLRRPEWEDVGPSDAEEPDLSALLARRDQLAAALAAVADRAGEVRRLTDEHSAAERRVASLEKQLRGARADDANVEELQRYLLAALTRANSVGPRSEAVPVVLDDPFTRVPAERKWELMDMLRRLAEKTQLLYLTDDPFIGAWARRRADNGTIRLLEPVE